MPEQPPVTLPLPFLEEQQPMTMLETWQLLRKAAVDSRIKALVLEPRDLEVGWAKLEELRGAIVAFKKSGKPVYAYLRGAGTKEYYVATAADRVYMAPEDELDVKGLRAELMFVKGTLDKLGVEMEFEHVGKYKDAPDMFTRTTPTPETLEVENQILDQYYGDIVNVIAEGRKKQPDAVKALIDDGPFVGKSALDGGLVDDLLFEDEMYGKLKDAAKLDSIKKIGERDYSRVEVAGVDGKTKIAFIVGQGDITRGGTNESASSDGITASGLVKLMRQVENDFVDQGSDSAHRFAGRRWHCVRRHSARGEIAEREEAGDHFHVRPGCVRRLLHRHDGRSGGGLSEYADGFDRRVFRQGGLEGIVR